MTLYQGKAFAGLNGIAPETIAQIIRGNRKQVTFDTADRIVVGLDSPEIWYMQLAPYYFPEGEAPEGFDKACELMASLR